MGTESGTDRTANADPSDSSEDAFVIIIYYALKGTRGPKTKNIKVFKYFPGFKVPGRGGGNQAASGNYFYSLFIGIPRLHLPG